MSLSKALHKTRREIRDEIARLDIERSVIEKQVKAIKQRRIDLRIKLYKLEANNADK